MFLFALGSHFFCCNTAPEVKEECPCHASVQLPDLAGELCSDSGMPSVVAAAASQEQEQQPAGGLLLEAASGVRYAPLTLLLHAPSRPEAEETTMQPNAEGAAERSRMLSISMYLHLSQLFDLTHFVQSMPLVGVCAQLCWKRCLQQPVMCYSILSCQHAAVQTHHAASEHHSTSWQSRSCLCGITAFLLHRMKSKVSSRQLVVMLWICKMTATTRKRCLPQGSSALIHCMTTVNYSSGSPSSQHAPQPASRFASATPAYQSTFSNPAYTGACLPCHSGSTHLRPFCLVLFSQAICSGILNQERAS